MAHPSSFASALATPNEARSTWLDADLYASCGAVLLGGLVALYFSGLVFMQVVLYWRQSSSDPIRTKAVVVFIWILDVVHSTTVCIANWENLISNFGILDGLDHITW
ncbi:hypothetical protein GSI_09269 [Ganoderma sinense ZZ0214-1]|uniref:Uncharacterized protein n=1 Tax=Ganoderma sinense ZZ0214-1 TaxID=1077348 RepID=A0A2G8S617_9APHY|nr:hypothetical protein GSI_09269 [Ganoderma sinense ZZ0214-1]